MFGFTKQFELVVRSVLSAKLICKYSGQDLRDVIERKISDNKLIMRAWNVLSRSITNWGINKFNIKKHSHTSDGWIKLATIAEPALHKTLCSGNWVSVLNNFQPR